MSLPELTGIIGPILLVVLAGYVSVRLGAFEKPGVGALSKFVVTFALPLALFRVLSSQDFSQIANVNYLIGVALGSGVTFLSGLLVGLVWSRSLLPVEIRIYWPSIWKAACHLRLLSRL